MLPSKKSMKIKSHRIASIDASVDGVITAVRVVVITTEMMVFFSVLSFRFFRFDSIFGSVFRRIIIISVAHRRRRRRRLTRFGGRGRGRVPIAVIHTHSLSSLFAHIFLIFTYIHFRCFFLIALISVLIWFC